MKRILSIILFVSFTASAQRINVQINPGGINADTEVFRPETYGAVGDGVTDDAAAFTAMHTALPDSGCIIELGPKHYRIDSSITFSKPFLMRGAGQGSKLLTYPDAVSGTIISTVNGAIDLFNITSPYFSIHDVLIRNLATTPTAGSAIKVTQGSAAWYAGGFRLRDVGIDGFYDNMNIVSSYGFVIDGVYCNNPVRYGFKVANEAWPDAGDAVISNSYFYPGSTRNAEAAIFQTSGGGLKILGNKFNGQGLEAGGDKRFKYFYKNSASGTTIVIINNNSFENWGVFNEGRAIEFTNPFSYVQIIGNEFAPYGTVTVGHIAFDGGGTIVVSDNMFVSTGTIVFAQSLTTSFILGPNDYGKTTDGTASSSVVIQGTGERDIWRPQVVQTLTGTTVKLSPSNGANAAITLTGNTTLSFSDLVSGDEGEVYITQDATGSRTFTISTTLTMKDVDIIGVPTTSTITVTYLKSDGTNADAIQTAANSKSLLNYRYVNGQLYVKITAI